MGFKRLADCNLFVIMLLIMVLFFRKSQSYQFNVGGRDGWVLNPSENYTLWAHRNRFQVNDTLFFKYTKGSDSVLTVSKEDFESCNTQNPKQSLTDGDSIFKFDRSGPFYFISGDTDHCKNGQKLIVIVMAIRSKPSLPNPPSPPATSPSLLLPPAVSPAHSPADSSAQPPPQSANSGSEGFAVFSRLALGASFGVSLILGSFV